MKRFLQDWIPGWHRPGNRYMASGDALKLRALLCWFGFCSPYYKYGVGEEYGYGEFKCHSQTHLGWHCYHCERQIAYAKVKKQWVVWNA